MIYQLYQTFYEYNKTGLDGILLYVTNIVPIFIPMTLVTEFLVVSLIMYFSQRALNGEGDFFVSITAGSVMAFVTAIALNNIDGLINLETILISLAVMVVCVIILFTTRDR